MMCTEAMAENAVTLVSGLWLPFMATAGASLTVLAIQSINRYIKEQRQRVYAAGYMADVAYRLLHSELILQKHTIVPHIESVKRMVAGDQELLELTLDSDEFDILSAGPMNFIQLSEDHKILVGYDNIQIVQAFDALLYLHSNDANRLALRAFVAENLKSKKKFTECSNEHQQDLLNSYWDYLRALEHEGKRVIAFVFYIFTPMLGRYVNSRKFNLFSKETISSMLDRIESLQSEFSDFVPPREFFEQSRGGGIQGVL